jgi:uncharacterized protein (TIGR02594 family)
MNTKYEFLLKETAPKVLVEALKLYGTKEIVGRQHNPVIMQWSKELDLEQIYISDEIPWCGLMVAIIVKRAGYDVVNNPLRARNWLDFGKVKTQAELFDVLVFERGTGGHVGFYVGEDKNCYHVFGGNQNNSTNVTRILKRRCIGIRECPWKIGKPSNIRQIQIDYKSKISKNES